MYGHNEYADMHLAYGFCKGNASAAAREYKARHPKRKHPPPRLFPKVHQMYMEGKLPGNVSNREVIHTRKENIVLDMITKNPSFSTRKLAKLVNLSKSSVHRIKKNWLDMASGDESDDEDDDMPLKKLKSEAKTEEKAAKPVMPSSRSTRAAKRDEPDGNDDINGGDDDEY